MPSQDIRKKFLEFFAKRDHAVIPSASLVPEGDASTLFTTAGMQPLAPYLLGTPHPKGKRVVDIQKCVRTGDIDDVGDNRHLTFFEMLGNWSFGDYFKEDAIRWSFELLTSKEEGFGLEVPRLYVTCFEGNDDAPQDTVSFETWKSVGISEDHIFFMGADDNWWSPGDNGPCGPDTEMFYDLKPEQGAIVGKESFIQTQKSGRVVEIWNDVFMEYERRDGKVVGKLATKNVDTGAGLERLATVLQGKQNVFETDLFSPIMEEIKKRSILFDEIPARIVADHIRASVFLILDGVQPAKQDRGSVLRNLIRRAIRNASILEFQDNYDLNEIALVVISSYQNAHPQLKDQRLEIVKVLTEEINLFEEGKESRDKILEKFEKYLKGQGKSPLQAKDYIPGKKIEADNPFISGIEAYELHSTFGISVEDIKYLAKKLHYILDEKSFEEERMRHREKSRAGSEQKFKGGLADASPEVTRLHTATHLLNAALKKVLGNHVKQKGSNITPERLRFDFAHPEKMTDEQRKAVENLINGWIAQEIPVVRKEIPREEAQLLGAEMEFGAKYPDIVSVYCIETPNEVISREFCGGPHVENTKEIGHVTLMKEEAVAAGVRRIKATCI